MSTFPDKDPALGDAPRLRCAIEQVIVPRAHDLGGFEVRRALPAVGRRMIGPFIFFDQMGPAEFLLAQGIDVRPHPHIGLATVTYLFDGRDRASRFARLRRADPPSPSNDRQLFPRVGDEARFALLLLLGKAKPAFEPNSFGLGALFRRVRSRHARCRARRS